MAQEVKYLSNRCLVNDPDKFFQASAWMSRRRSGRGRDFGVTKKHLLKNKLVPRKHLVPGTSFVKTMTLEAGSSPKEWTQDPVIQSCDTLYLHENLRRSLAFTCWSCDLTPILANAINLEVNNFNPFLVKLT